MARSVWGLMVAANAACSVFILPSLVACGSDSDTSEPAVSQSPESEPPSDRGGNGSASERPAGAAAPSSSSESNVGVDGQTPLAPVSVDGEPSGSEMPSGEMPPATETPLEDLVVVEFPIPDDLPGCGSPYPHDPAVDEATGLIYYAGSNESCIGQFNPETGAFQAWPTATPDSYPHGLVVSDGRVYFTGIDQNLIGSVDPATGEAVDYPVAADGPHTPTLHAGALWFTAQRGGQFGRLDLESGEAEVFSLSSANTGPYGIWPAPDGSLWVALFGTNRLARIDTAATPASAEEFVLPQADSRPRRIAVDAQGKVWFADYPRRALGLLDPSLPEGEQVKEFPTPGGGRPYGIAVGPDGRVWYNDQDASEIVGFDQATESVVARLDLEIDNPGPVRNIAVDQPRRRLWLAISNVGRLAMIQF
jgi:virginiamycin B lyase